MIDDDDKLASGRAARSFAAAEGSLLASCAFSLGAAAAYVLASPLVAPLMMASFVTLCVSLPAVMVSGALEHHDSDKDNREFKLVGLGAGLLVGAAAAGLVLTAPALKPQPIFNKAAKVAVAQSLGSVPPTPQTTPQIAHKHHYLR